MFKPTLLWQAPEVNPINHKARSLPLLNPVNVYGRVFFFSWFAFFLAFWSWFAFPPLLSDVIAADIHASKNMVANSNVIALTATLLVRLIAGPACDRYGPRLTFAACLLAGALPTFLAGTIHNAAGLYTIRFFVGILGGSFVPCQVWTTGFFDKNIVGTANSITAGLGNAGGGITYFLMPAIFNSLVHKQHLKTHVAWRVAFVVPGIIITIAAIALVLCCPDTPTGRWSDRFQAAENNLRIHGGVEGKVVNIQGDLTTVPTNERSSDNEVDIENEKKHQKRADPNFGANEAHMSEKEMEDTARGEVIQKPSFGEIVRVMASPQTLVVGVCYFCTFGTELSVNSILGTWYKANFPKLTLQEAGNYAAIFGILNAIIRPLGGAFADFAYKRTGSVWSKKVLLHIYCALTGVFCIAAGATNSKNKAILMGLMNGGIAFFMEGANGLNYALVPHVHPYANGVVSGFTGACGNLGGIVFAIIFRYNKTHYGKTLWIIGTIILALQLAVCWIKPVAKSQVGR